MRTFTLSVIYYSDKNQWIYSSPILSRTILIFHFTKIGLQFGSKDFIYIFQETRLSVRSCRIFAEAFIFQFYPFPGGKFFGLISRDRRFRGGNRLYSIRPTELIAVIPLPSPHHRIVHRSSIRIFVFQFFFPPLPMIHTFFPPFNHRIGWAQFCEKSLKPADPPSPSPEIRWRDHFFLPRDCKRTNVYSQRNFFPLLIVVRIIADNEFRYR